MKVCNLFAFPEFTLIILHLEKKLFLQMRAFIPLIVTRNILKKGKNLKQLFKNDFKKKCEKKKVSFSFYRAGMIFDTFIRGIDDICFIR